MECIQSEPCPGGACLKVVTACVKGFFGLKIQGRQFMTVWRGLFENIMDVNVYDTTAATICLIMLFCLMVKIFNIFIFANFF